MILLHACVTCANGLTEHRGASCVRCIAKFEADFNPSDRTSVKPKRLTWWQKRALRRRFLHAVKNYRMEIVP